MKDLDQMSFKELIDYCTGQVLMKLIRGDLRDGVADAVHTVISWSQVKAEAKAAPTEPTEAAEVVCITQGGCNVTWTATKELTPAGTELMSVRQHNRIMASLSADDPNMVKVPMDLLERIDEVLSCHYESFDPLREELRALLANNGVVKG